VTRVLFVCLGNICRSPLAEGLFAHCVAERGLQELYSTDSAGTSGAHDGEPAHRSSIAVAKKHGVSVPSISRRVVASDFSEFDIIVAMDGANLSDLQACRPAGSSARLVKMRDYDPQGAGDVPDPYYGGRSGFDGIYVMLSRCCEAMLDELQADA
jgi:protein-tyrosine phosphatase